MGAAPGEREQLLGQVGGELGGLAHLLDELGRGVVCGQLFERVLGVHQHAQQQVVEVVGDPAGQLADGFELLALHQPALHRPLLGEVAGCAVDAAAVARGPGEPADDDALAHRQQGAELHLRAVALHRRPDRGVVVGVDGVEVRGALEL